MPAVEFVVGFAGFVVAFVASFINFFVFVVEFICFFMIVTLHAAIISHSFIIFSSPSIKYLIFAVQ